MMRILKGIILGMVLLFSLTGCQAKQEARIPTASSPAQTTGTQTQAQEYNEDQIIVSRTLGFGRVNEKPYGAFFKKEEIAAFEEAIISADKMLGILNVDEPDYDVVLMAGGKRKELHLWIDTNSKYGMFTYVSDTGQGYRLTEQSTRALHNLIWGLEYSPEQAEANGDVLVYNEELVNSDIWAKYVSKVKEGSQAEVQVVHYTIEGSPIFNNLSFDGETIRNKYDNRRDAYGTPMKRYAFCSSLEEKKSERGKEYKLASCGEGENEEGWFSLLIP
jgi:hypothetical protein